MRVNVWNSCFTQRQHYHAAPARDAGYWHSIKSDRAEVPLTRGLLRVNILSCAQIKHAPVCPPTPLTLSSHGDRVGHAESWQLKMWPIKHQGTWLHQPVKSTYCPGFSIVILKHQGYAKVCSRCCVRICVHECVCSGGACSPLSWKCVTQRARQQSESRAPAARVAAPQTNSSR